MPDTITGLLIFVVLLAPGVTYSAVRRLVAPERDKSTLRETAGTVFVSAVCLVIVLALFGVLRILWSHGTPDVGRFISSPSEYFDDHYVEVSLWGIGILSVACLLGAGLGWVLPIAHRSEFESAWRELFVSGWFNAFDERERWWRNPFKKRKGAGPVFVGCELNDGAYLSGVLNTFSNEVDETEDREISFVSPIYYRPKGSKHARPLVTGTLSISARQIRFLTASYFPRGHAWASEAEQGEEAARAE